MKRRSNTLWSSYQWENNSLYEVLSLLPFSSILFDACWLPPLRSIPADPRSSIPFFLPPPPLPLDVIRSRILCRRRHLLLQSAQDVPSTSRIGHHLPKDSTSCRFRFSHGVNLPRVRSPLSSQICFSFANDDDGSQCSASMNAQRSTDPRDDHSSALLTEVEPEVVAAPAAPKSVSSENGSSPSYVVSTLAPFRDHATDSVQTEKK